MPPPPRKGAPRLDHDRPGFLQRLGAEVYVAGMVIGLLAVVIAVVVVLVQAMFGVSDWVRMTE